MTEQYLDPEDIISDFLRVNLTDPRERAEASGTNNFTATASQTEFTITPTSGSVSCVTAVTVEAVSKSKWQDYYWDYQNSKIIFFTGLTVDDAVVVTFKYGTSNWIYSDRPDDALSSLKFPRISVFTVSNPGIRLGNSDAPVQGTPNLQIDVWTKDGQAFTISGKKYANNYLSRYLGNRITRAFEESESDLFPALYNYRPLSGARTAPYSEEFQAHHTIVEVTVQGIDIGRVET